MNRQNPAFILIFKDIGALGCSLKPGGVMIGRIVVANRGVITTRCKLEVVAGCVLDQNSFWIRLKPIVLVRLKNKLRQKFQLVRQVGSNKKVELPDAERGGLTPLSSSV